MMKMKKIILGLFMIMLLFATAHVASADVLINEVELNPDGLGGDQWVELYNDGESPFDVNGYKLYHDTALGEMEFHAWTVSTSIAVDGYLVVQSGSWDLDETGDYIKLKTGATEVDHFPGSGSKTDISNDGTTWQRYPNGNDTNQTSDWSFRASTKSSTNGGLTCDGERPDDTNWTACIDGEQSRTTHVCNESTGEWYEVNNTYDECEWGTCTISETQNRSFYEDDNTSLTEVSNDCTGWSVCGDVDGGSTMDYKARWTALVTDSEDGSDTPSYTWKWCEYSEDDSNWNVDIGIYPGWNLFSLPYYLVDNDPEAIFGTYDEDTNNYTIWSYRPTMEGDNKWKSFPYTNESDPTALVDLEPPYAYWINYEISSSATDGSSAPFKNIALEGTYGTKDLPNTFTFYEGWNLIGAYGLNTVSFGTLWSEHDYDDSRVQTLVDCDIVDITHQGVTSYHTECTQSRNRIGGYGMNGWYQVVVPTYGYWMYLYENQSYIPSMVSDSWAYQGDYNNVDDFPIFSH